MIKMDIPFTKINLTMFLTYVSILSTEFFGGKEMIELKKLYRWNKVLGAVTFNTSLGIMSAWEPVRILYPKASQHLVNKVTKAYNISRPVFEFINFVTHIFPVIYLWIVRKHWMKYSKNPNTLLFSLFIHGLWVKLVPKHYNLNRIYMYSDPILNDKEWLSLWVLSMWGHSFMFLKQNMN